MRKNKKSCSISEFCRNNNFRTLEFSFKQTERRQYEQYAYISDEIALAHGLEIIEHPKKSYCHKYGEYKARKKGRSWKQKLCDDIDNAIMKENVRSIDDLLKELMKRAMVSSEGNIFP